MRDWLLKRAAIKSAKQAESVEVTYCGWVIDGGAEPEKTGALRIVFPDSHTLPVEGSANHFSEAIPNTTSAGRNLVTAHYRQAKLYSRNLFNIATGPGSVNRTARPAAPAAPAEPDQ